MGFTYEHRTAPLLSRRKFIRRLLRHGLLAAALALFSLLAGMIGYMTLADMNAVDAFLNAAMLLGGMGQVGELHGDAAKIFAGVYALYAGVVFIATAGILVAPVAHRLLHSFHLEGAQTSDKPRRGKSRPSHSS